MPNPSQELNQLKQELAELKSWKERFAIDYEKHQHSPEDGTNILRKNIELDIGQWMQVGLNSQGTVNDGAASGQIQHAFSVGKDDGRRGVVTKADIMQVDYLHQPSTALSFIIGRRTPVVSSGADGSKISVSAAGNTVTINGFNFTTNELANALINIYNSSGAYVCTRTITSNTSTVVTITGTWGTTVSGGTFDIYRPVYFGAAEYIWQRFYAQEGTAGGVRFGVGATAGGENGLLYMDATGNLYYRNKAGTSIKLNRTDAEISALGGISASQAEDIAQGIMDTHESTYDHSSL
jgi:hypothetical protein